MLVKIKRGHIAKAQRVLVDSDRCKSLHCPVAQGLKDIFPGECVIVGFTSVQIGAHLIPLPTEATKRIHKFDDTLQMKPFSFSLNHH